MESNNTAEMHMNNNFRSRMVIFIITIMTMLLLLNYYNFVHFRFQFGPWPDYVFWPLFIFMSQSMLIAFTLTMYFFGRFTQIFYFFSMVWLGFSILCLILLGAHDIIRLFVSVDATVTVKIVILIAVVMTLAGMINARFIRTKKITLKAKNLQKNIRIIQLSDIHMGLVHGRRFLTRLVNKVNSLKPDLILITGDVIDGPFRSPESLYTPLKKLNAPAYFSTGNHEYMVGINYSLDIIRKMGIKIIRNESLEINNNIQLIAIDDRWEGDMSLSGLFTTEKPDPNKYTILMSHQPRDFDIAANAGVDLMLSGHTHGGQFFPMILFTPLMYKWGKGLYKLNGSTLYTTTGVGTWGPPIRLGSNGELVLIELKAK
ncbi:metallophosphoesterase [[Eubacterium] cellulosolvens]